VKLTVASMDAVRLTDLSPDDAAAVDEAIGLADALLREALANSTRRERRQLHRLGAWWPTRRVASWSSG
jgi:hypothetical protein